MRMFFVDIRWLNDSHNPREERWCVLADDGESAVALLNEYQFFGRLTDDDVEVQWYQAPSRFQVWES